MSSADAVYSCLLINPFSYSPVVMLLNGFRLNSSENTEASPRLSVFDLRGRIPVQLDYCTYQKITSANTTPAEVTQASSATK